MNVIGAITGNPRFYYIKTILCKNCLKHTFSDNNGAIVASHHICFAC